MTYEQILALTICLIVVVKAYSMMFDWLTKGNCNPKSKYSNDFETWWNK